MTSGSINFNQNRNEIIIDAFSAIKVFAIDEVPPPEDMNLAARVLNRMVKAWQADGIHLWKKKEATLFLAKDTHKYLLGGTNSWHATENYVSTTLSADGVLGALTLTVTSSSGMTAADYIGIVLDDNTLFWTTIDTVLSTTSVSIDEALPSAATSGNYVFTYTAKITRPLLVSSARRYTIVDGYEIPITLYSHQQYYDLPIKSIPGMPLIVNYDPQLGSGILNVWPQPSDISSLINYTYAKSIEDFDTSLDDPDFPQEWLDTLVLNLAKKLGPHYGKTNSTDYKNVVADAEITLRQAKRFDSETGSIFIQPFTPN